MSLTWTTDESYIPSPVYKTDEWSGERSGGETWLAGWYLAAAVLWNVFSVLGWLGSCPSRQVYTQPLLFSTVCLPAPKQLQVVFIKVLLPVQFVFWQAERLVLFIAQQQWCVGTASSFLLKNKTLSDCSHTIISTSFLSAEHVRHLYLSSGLVSGNCIIWFSW